MEIDEAKTRLAGSRVARLATVDVNNQPHIVPVTFAVAGEMIVTAIDHKPKSSHDLKRLRNIRANPLVAFLADHYGDDWDSLWWVRADGSADIVEDEQERAAPVRWLAEKYEQYRYRPPDGPVIRATVHHLRGWSARATNPCER